MRASTRRLAGLVVAAIGLVLIAPMAIASAQEPTEVVGTADFRNPPTLVDGRYVDTIVTGETVWYAVVYANSTPYRFEVSLADVDVDADDELTLEASFVGPTLGSVGRSSTVLESSGASYGSAKTNVWYLKVSLETTGRLGVEHRLLIEVVGAESTGFGDCTQIAECTLDEELATIDEQVELVESGLADALAQDETSLVEREITSLRDQLGVSDTIGPQAQARLANAEARMAQLCAPDATCETIPAPGSKTPIWAWAIGGLVFAGGVRRRVTTMRSPIPATD